MSNNTEEKNKGTQEVQENTDVKQKSPSSSKVEKTGKESVQKQDKKPEKEAKKESASPATVVEESGINLIPIMTKEEIKAEDTKKKVKMSSLISLMALFVVSILVVGFNIISRIQLDAQKATVADQERTIQGYSNIISGNTEILERVYLFQDIEEERYSIKLVVEYLEGVASKSGRNVLTDFTFSDTESFQFSGESQSLEEIAKLWFLMTNDAKIEDVELRSFSSSDQGARFSFRGTIILEEFTSL